MGQNLAGNMWTVEVCCEHRYRCKMGNAKTCLCAEENKQVDGERLLMRDRKWVTRKAKILRRQVRT